MVNKSRLENLENNSDDFQLHLEHNATGMDGLRELSVEDDGGHETPKLRDKSKHWVISNKHWVISS